MARSSCCPTLFTFLTRLVGLLFLVAAALSIPEAWKLNESEYTSSENDNKTIFVPIEICDKSSITIDGQAVVFKTRSDESNDGNSNNSDCHTLEYLINACVASILFAGAATIIFFIFDLLARYHTSGPVSRSAVLGMSFFLSFILVQTAACCYALYMECDYWEEYFTERFSELNGTATADDVDIQTYGNKLYFLGTGGLALIGALLLFLDTLLQFCAGGSGGSGNNKTKQANNKAKEATTPVREEQSVAPTTTHKQQEQAPPQTPPTGYHSTAASVSPSTDDGYSFAQDSAIDESRHTQKWTNY